MWTWLLLLAILFAWLLVWYDVPNRVKSHRRRMRTLKKIPGKPTHFLWGNLHQVDLTEECMWRIRAEARQKQWPLMHLWIGPVFHVVYLYNPEHIKKILKASKPDVIYGLFRPWLGTGLLIANGDQWYRNRRLLTPAFHFDILKPYVHIYNDCTDVLLRKWEEAARSGEAVEVFKSISKLSLDVLLQCAFSFESHCQESSEREQSPYIKSVHTLCDLTTKRRMSPFLSVLGDFVFLYCTPTGWKYRKALGIVHRQSDKVIRERRQSLGLNDSNKKMRRRQSEVFKLARAAHKYLDFLDVLLTAEDEDGCGLSDIEIRSEVDTFMFEGHDTTANGMMWTLYLLAKNPEHQEKCREEICAVLQDREHLDYDDLSKLSYTTMCIKESLRLYPPVHEIYRILGEDFEFSGYEVMKDTVVAISVFSIHHSHQLWENPQEFDPLRFHPDNTSERNAFAYIPFSAGPRNCIGQNFALNEMKTVISSIIRRFKMTLIEDHEVEMVPVVILKAKNDIKIRLSPV